MKNQTYTKRGPGRMVVNRKKGTPRYAPSYYPQSLMKYDAEVTAAIRNGIDRPSRIRRVEKRK